uniref:transposase n=1 Tax=Rhizobium sp. PDO1-076 TaxID=1125979 RepID=UPI0005687A01
MRTKTWTTKEVVHVFIADKIRAVELYIKLGKRVRATIRQLGNPTKNALKGWRREYEQRLNLPWAVLSEPPNGLASEKWR